VLPVSVHGLNSGEFGEPFRLSELDCEKSVLKAPDGAEHVVLFGGGRQIQLACRGNSMLDDTVCLAFPIAAMEDQQRKIMALNRLLSVAKFKCIDPNNFKPHPRSRRLRFTIQVLDGMLAGASHREIAIQLYGAEKVAQDWNDPGNHLKDQIRKTVRRGRDLMNGKYRNLAG